MIADEAQDLISSDGVMELDRLVRGGLAGGRWVIFLDPNEQARFRGILDPAALEMLKDIPHADVVLGRNLRNTYEIVRSVQEVTSADIGVPGGGHGPDAAIEFIRDESEFPGVARTLLAKLSGQQVRPEEIGVVTWSEPTDVHTALDGRPYPTVVLQEGTPRESLAGRVAIASPAAIQGLEVTHAILGPMPSPGGAEAIASIYVASTRPQATLWYVATTEVAQELAHVGMRREP
jgi:hypothetical protein